MIEFVSITKKFRNNFWEKDFFALENVSFVINQGEMVGFLGANGAGKTTLIKSLMDFSRPTKGSIKFDETLGGNALEIRSKIGYLPERAYLYQHLTGREFLTHAAELNSIPSPIAVQRIHKWADRIQINHALDRKIHTYSKGMQQRLGFISALIHEPRFLVLDEPLSGLDPIGRRDFKKILKELNDTGVTVFFSTHIVSDVEELCNKVIFIEKGKLIYKGAVEELIAQNSSDQFTITYIKNGNSFIETIEEKNKNKFISSLLENNCNIIRVEKSSLTLEEIIYQIKR